MCIIICDVMIKKYIIHLNNGSMVKDLFFKHGEWSKPSHLHPRLMGYIFRWARFLT